MKIVLSDDIEYSKLSGNIYGSLCIKDGDMLFPDGEWTDLICPVLNWWADEFIRAVMHEGRMRLMFMDGTYCMMGMIKGKNIEISCYDNYSCEGEPLEKFVCSADEFRNELIKGLRLCHAMLSDVNDMKGSEKCEGQIKALAEIV